jgi:hypothetical protein
VDGDNRDEQVFVIVEISVDGGPGHASFLCDVLHRCLADAVALDAPFGGREGKIPWVFDDRDILTLAACGPCPAIRLEDLHKYVSCSLQFCVADCSLPCRFPSGSWREDEGCGSSISAVVSERRAASVAARPVVAWHTAAGLDDRFTGEWLIDMDHSTRARWSR